MRKHPWTDVKFRQHPPLPPNRRARRPRPEPSRQKHQRRPRPLGRPDRSRRHPARNPSSRLHTSRREHDVRGQRDRSLHDSPSRRERDDPLGQRRQHCHDRFHERHSGQPRKPLHPNIPQSKYESKADTTQGLICPAYNASKAAVLQLGRNLASEWGSYGIRVNTISPGYIATAMVEALFEKYPERRRDWPTQNMLGKLSVPEEYRGAAVFCISDASSFMTGSDLRIDGGHTAW
jgi:hypothetical protein